MKISVNEKNKQKKSTKNTEVFRVTVTFCHPHGAMATVQKQFEPHCRNIQYRTKYGTENSPTTNAVFTPVRVTFA